MTEPTADRPSTPHASHDRLLVASGLDPDALADERLRLERQLADCADCRALASELASISAAIHTDLPQPSRPRDFRLGPDEAARLRGSPLSRLLERLAMPSFGALQPLAGVAMALGITLIVLNSVSLPFGGMGAAPAALDAVDQTVSAEGAPGAAEPSPDTAGSPVPFQTPGAQASPSGRQYVDTGSLSGGATAQPLPTATTGAVLGPKDTSVTPQPSDAARVAAEAGQDRQAPPAGLVAGTVLFVGGALLLALRWLGRRRLEGLD